MGGVAEMIDRDWIEYRADRERATCDIDRTIQARRTVDDYAAVKGLLTYPLVLGKKIDSDDILNDIRK